MCRVNPQNSEQKHRAKKFAKFLNHFPQLAMLSLVKCFTTETTENTWRAQLLYTSAKHCSIGFSQIRHYSQNHFHSRSIRAEKTKPFFSQKFSKAKKKKHMFFVRISIKKRAGGWFFLLYIISYYMLFLRIITFPQGYFGALRSNINETKHQMLIKHKFV